MIYVDLLALKASQREAQTKNEKSGEMYVFAAKQVKCTRCGHVPKKPQSYFYKRSDSPLFPAQDGLMCVCKTCAGAIFQEYTDQYDDIKFAVQRFCCDFNYYYDEQLLINLIGDGNFSIGTYIVKNNSTNRGKTFANNFSELVSNGTVDARKDSSAPVKWSIEDKKNKENVCMKVGYDPFVESGYTEDQLKFLYNSCAGYLADDAVEQDPHKLQNVIMMVKTFLQLETIDRLINEQFISVQPDTSLISSLTTMKEKLSNTITRIANENGFSEKTSGKSSQGSNTFSGKMKEMLENDFSLSKVNIHDVRMAESFREVASMSSHALIEEMNLTGDDWARLCAEQRTFVTELQENNEKLEEENRLLYIKVKDLEGQIKAAKK